MISNYSCPICNENKWKSVQKYTYNANDHLAKKSHCSDRLATVMQNLSHLYCTLLFAAPKPANISSHTLTSNDRFKRQLWFDVFFRNNEQVIITSQYCMRCGLMTYTPRPTEEDVIAQYKVLGEHRPPQAMDRLITFLEGDSYSKRNRMAIYSLVTKAVTGRNLKILDFGGMIGWYLVPFHKAGHECALVDFTSVHLPEVKKIGNDLHDLPNSETFDAIICRAVLEHVVHPLLTVKRFHRSLKTGGVVYALVPNEIFAGVKRLRTDPATHVNFFNSKNFSLLFKLAGFAIITSGMDAWEPNMWILARKTKTTISAEITDEADLTQDLLYPRRWYSLRRILIKVLARSFPRGDIAALRC